MTPKLKEKWREPGGEGQKAQHQGQRRNEKQHVAPKKVQVIQCCWSLESEVEHGED